MNCPICGKELPDKAKKCGNCGCRPKHLYGRPRPPKWMFATALALVAVLVAGVAALPLLSPPDPVVDIPEETEPEFWELSLRKSKNSYLSFADYSYDENGNLKEVTYSNPFSSSSTAISVGVLFTYDENGIFTGFERQYGMAGTATSGTVSYDEDQRRVTVIVTTNTQEQNYIFQYDEQNRLVSTACNLYYNSDITSDQQIRWELSYDGAGKLHTYTVWQAEGDFLRKLRVDTMQYADDGALIGYTRLHPSAQQVDNYQCYTDERGNVLKEESPTQPAYAEHNYTYITQTVTARTAWQYELQLQLLFMMGIGPENTVLPIIKTPSNQGGSL